ncbi:TRAP transporter substrate-binding protein [Rhizobium sp. NFR07]|uniref:TRAP transporter substrate-binding protein n=1 Tax=Rhizobium sp. NFR07 TaxID=1566262 RepID=UPI001AED0173|nr:TRAP transporter substrate-binding protein [Rhizobium sp. NFR07]
MMVTHFNRRSLLKGIAAAPIAGAAFSIPRLAGAAEIQLRYGNNLPLSHPLNVRAKEAADRIARETDGKVEMLIFPANQLGGDTDMLSQVRGGALTFFTPSSLVIATLVPTAALNAVGFAFNGYEQVWKAMDGPVGKLVRQKIEGSRLYALETMWDNGFRQTTTSGVPITTADGMKGLKIRVPVSPLSIDMFSALGASPTSLQFSEVYSALQTKVVDAQENPLPIIQVAKLYEVQENCALSNHIWDGYWFIANGRQWSDLKDDLKTIVAGALNEAGLKQRQDIASLNAGVQADLEKAGMTFNKVDTESFRAKLRQGGFYAKWSKEFGDEAWGALESVVGSLA